MSDFKNYLAQQMEDPAFAAEYEAQRPEYEAIRAVIAARLACNMTQKELAEKSGTSLRMVQLYEQRKQDIRKAEAQTLVNLSRVLGCGVEDLFD